MMEIVVYEGEYDRSEFYSKMGKYFAEKEYQNELPYLHNEEGKIWFVAMEEGKVAGFASLVIENTKIVLATSYVEPEFRKRGFYKKLIDANMKYCKGIEKPFVCTTNNEIFKKHLEKLGFEIYRQTKNYWFLRKEVEHEKRD